MNTRLQHVRIILSDGRSGWFYGPELFTPSDKDNPKVYAVGVQWTPGVEIGLGTMRHEAIAQATEGSAGR